MEVAARIGVLDPTARNSAIASGSVIEAGEKQLLLDIDGQRHWAVMALAYRYEALPGDKVLVANDGETYYVIGVLEGRGTTSFVAPGDIEFRAPRGCIDMVAAKSINMRSPKFQVSSTTLELVADRAVHRFNSLDQWVRETIYTHAGRMLNRVKETYRLNAGKIVGRAKGAVKIDGDEIKLG